MSIMRKRKATAEEWTAIYEALKRAEGSLHEVVIERELGSIAPVRLSDEVARLQRRIALVRHRIESEAELRGH